MVLASADIFPRPYKLHKKQFSVALLSRFSHIIQCLVCQLILYAKCDFLATSKTLEIIRKTTAEWFFLGCELTVRLGIVVLQRCFFAKIFLERRCLIWYK
ncbi:MAG: hypothetical protein AMJ75_04000 [Phycisphaerae bacterium SM1_79]|nr:MAG: hypothetical protein AMJ75_04000 [Phycisphaerae bacterium SM1_79]